jgi:capsular exopolysaccharide synthesis family protein
MSILRALQKKRAEGLNGDASKASNGTVSSTNGTPNGGSAVARRSEPPELLASSEFSIGRPSSAFIGQPGANIGTALPDVISDTSAGATLNADSLTRSAEKRLPDFVSWTVDAERVEPRLVSITHPNSSYCEEYRSLRTHILHKSQRQKLQSIVVASVNPSEGKSVTALNLSWLLAQTDTVNALIIDSDLRMPSLADYLGIETDKGLSDILSGTCSLNDAIIRLEPAGLHILPGGDARPDVAELISGPKFKDILAEAREMFDYIIIDAPPLGIFTDATVLINHADGALLVLRANRTKFSTLDRILDPLPKERMLGVVLNQSPDVMDESHYNYGYYNYRRLNESLSP